ncbi:MAG: fibronectin type III domain-containing protein [Caldilineaceae bacterium]
MNSSGTRRFTFWLVILGVGMGIASLFIRSDPAAPRLLQAAVVSLPDPSADRVLGQVNYTNREPDVLYGPSGVAIASDGRLFVVEASNHEVSSWPNAATFASAASPDLVIGAYGDSPTASTFYQPESIAVDGSNNLWVSDILNNRVLRIPPPYTAGADLVLGQADFTSNESNRGGQPAANTLNFPRGLAFDSAGNLYVADTFNNRVVQFAPPFSNGAAAVGLFGQPSFADDTARTTNDGLYVPTSVVAHPNGYIFIADRNNNRVLRWTPGTATADLVLGQPNFETTPAFYSGNLPPDYNDYAECVQNPFASVTVPSPSDTNLSHPLDLAIDSAGNLLVSDICWHRVVVYFGDNFSDRTADKVYGQLDFNSGALQTPGRKSFHTPLGLSYFGGSLFVADYGNNRLLAFDPDTTLPTNTPTPTATATAQTTATPTPTPTQIGPPPAGDAFEDDDSCDRARFIDTTGSKQSHTFHDLGDTDWLRFSAQAGKTYVIQVENKGADADAVLALFDLCNQSPNAQNNNSFGSTVTIEWDSARNGDYYIQIQQFDPAFFGADVTYEVSVKIDQVPPSAPKKLRCIAVNSTTLGLQWDASPERDVRGYRVTYTGNISGAEDVDGKSSTFYQVGNLTAGQTYNLRVRALDFSGNESAPSGEVPCLASQPVDATIPSFTLQQPGASGIISTSASLATFVGLASDAGGNLSRAQVHNATLNQEGWDYTLTGASDDFRVADVALAPGDNTVHVKIIDAAGNSSQQTVTVRRLGSSPGAVLIVAGQNETLALQTNIYFSANRAYRIALSAGYDADSIYYIAPVGQDANGDGTNDVDSSPASPAALENAIVTWAKAGGKVGPGKPLFVYMIDHGLEEKFCLGGCNSGYVSPKDMDGWLTTLENETGLDQVTIVIEACRSGSFIDRVPDVLGSLSKAGRVVITSTSKEKNAYASAQGAYFSDTFFSCVADSNNLKACFDQASQAVKTMDVGQLPMLDDNGDGVFNSDDGLQAQNRYLTRFFSSIRSQITSAHVERQGNDGLLSATVQEGGEAIEVVWAAVFPPSFQEPENVTLNLNVPIVRLSVDPNTPGRYTVSYPNGFTKPGDYRVVFYAQDRLGIQALPRQAGEGQAVYLPAVSR